MKIYIIKLNNIKYKNIKNIIYKSFNHSFITNYVFDYFR